MHLDELVDRLLSFGSELKKISEGMPQTLEEFHASKKAGKHSFPSLKMMAARIAGLEAKLKGAKVEAAVVVNELE
eukprot:2593053-Karenia_brevis.AAC.1